MPRQIATEVTDLARGLDALTGVLLEAPPDEGRERRGQIAAPIGDGRRCVAQDRRGQLDRRSALERTLPAGHLVQHDAEREDVRAVIHRAPGDLLGRHVGHRAHHDPLARLQERLVRCHVLRTCRTGTCSTHRRTSHASHCRTQFREAEVEHLDAAVGGDHDVGRLEIAVDDALVVRGGQCVGDRERDRHQAFTGQTAVGNQSIERLTLDQLHREEVDAVRFLDRIDRDDVRMVEGGDGAGLALEAGEPVGIAGEIRGQHLERDLATELRVAGAIHFAHTACPERRSQHVMTKPRTWYEAHEGGMSVSL